MSMSEWSLHVVPPSGEPFHCDLEGESLTIGRASDAGLTVADRYLSRHHSRLSRHPGGWQIEDLGSRNGTLVNGQRIAASTPLAAGDVIQVSATRLTLQRGGATAQQEHGGLGDSGATIFRDAVELLDRDRSSTVETLAPAKLERLVERMRLLNEVHQGLARHARFDELLDLILDRIFRHLQPEEAVIFLTQPDGQLQRAASRSLPGLAGETLYSRRLAEEVTEKKLAALVLDAVTDSRFAAAESILSQGVRSLLAAPLLDPEGCQGMIVLSSRTKVRLFGEEDLELLVSLASVAAMRLRNATLAEEAAARRVLEEELALARRLQLALLPHEIPQPEGFELYGLNIPSRTVSGDYYTVHLRDEDRQCFLMLADVSGKGVAASLLTASLEALCAVPIRTGTPPHEIGELVGGLLLQRTPPEKYATAFLASLDLSTGVLSFANAGHNPPFVARRLGGIVSLPATGPPLGLLPGARYRNDSLALEPGDLLVIYTDGITESEGAEGEEYGMERLQQVVLRHRGEALEDIARALEEDLVELAQGKPFADDRTLLMVRRRE
jgi:phosphoserine phosphatase RsbU/P